MKSSFRRESYKTLFAMEQVLDRSIPAAGMGCGGANPPPSRGGMVAAAEASGEEDVAIMWSARAASAAAGLKEPSMGLRRWSGGRWGQGCGRGTVTFSVMVGCSSATLFVLRQPPKLGDVFCRCCNFGVFFFAYRAAIGVQFLPCLVM